MINLLVSDVFRVLEWIVGAWSDIVGSGDDKVFSDALRTLKIDRHILGDCCEYCLLLATML